MYSDKYEQKHLIKQKFNGFVLVLLLPSSIVIHSINFSFSTFFVIYFIMTFFWVLKFVKETDQNDLQKKLEKKRNQWFANTLIEVGRENDLDSHKFNRQVQKITPDATVYHFENELSISINPDIFIETLPDIGLIEGEITDLERKIAKVFVLFVFSPFIFVLFHYFFQFKLEYVLLNVINAIIIIDGFSNELRASPNIKGWTDFKHRIMTLKNEILYNPKMAWNNFILNSKNITGNELVDGLIILNENWITKIEQLLYKTCINFDRQISFSLISNFLEKTKGLEIAEDIQSKKWNSFSMQFTFLSISVYFFISILSSIFNLFYRILDDTVIFMPFFIQNNYLEIEFLQLILLTVILISYSTIFHSEKKTLVLVLFCLSEYLLIRIFLLTFFELII